MTFVASFCHELQCAHFLFSLESTQGYIQKPKLIITIITLIFQIKEMLGQLSLLSPKICELLNVLLISDPVEY